MKQNLEQTALRKITLRIVPYVMLVYWFCCFNDESGVGIF